MLRSTVISWTGPRDHVEQCLRLVQTHCWHTTAPSLNQKHHFVWRRLLPALNQQLGAVLEPHAQHIAQSVVFRENLTMHNNMSQR